MVVSSTEFCLRFPIMAKSAHYFWLYCLTTDSVKKILRLVNARQTFSNAEPPLVVLMHQLPWLHDGESV